MSLILVFIFSPLFMKIRGVFWVPFTNYTFAVLTRAKSQTKESLRAAYVMLLITCKTFVTGFSLILIFRVLLCN